MEQRLADSFHPAACTWDAAVFRLGQLQCGLNLDQVASWAKRHGLKPCSQDNKTQTALLVYMAIIAGIAAIILARSCWLQVRYSRQRQSQQHSG